MNKKVNTILFILGATLFQVLVAILSFILIILLYAKFLGPHLPENAVQWSLIVIFIASLAISFVVYRAALKVLLKKINVDKYFDPLFVRKNIRKTGD